MEARRRGKEETRPVLATGRKYSTNAGPGNIRGDDRQKERISVNI
jgi:hypothetical protein